MRSWIGVPSDAPIPSWAVMFRRVLLCYWGTKPTTHVVFVSLITHSRTQKQTEIEVTHFSQPARPVYSSLSPYTADCVVLAHIVFEDTNENYDSLHDRHSYVLTLILRRNNNFRGSMKLGMLLLSLLLAVSAQAEYLVSWDKLVTEPDALIGAW